MKLEQLMTKKDRKKFNRSSYNITFYNVLIITQVVTDYSALSSVINTEYK